MNRAAAISWILTFLILPLIMFAEQITPPLELTVSECIVQALENNPQIVIARNQITAASGEAKSAKANRYPNVTWNATVARSNTLPEFKSGDPTMFPVSPPVANDEGDPAPVAPHTHLLGFPGFEFTNTREGNIYIVNFQAGLPLYTGGKLTKGIEAAMLEVRATEENMKKQELDLVYQIKQIFYGALLAREMIGVIEEAIATAQARYQWIQDLYQEGMVSNLDMLQVEARVAGLEPQRIEAENQLSNALLGLKVMMDLDPSIPIELNGELVYEPEPLPSLEEVVAKAMMFRPDLRQVAIRKAQAEKMVHIAKAGYMPTVAGFAKYEWSMGQDMPPNDKKWRDGWQAGLNVTVPVFDGGAAAGDIISANSRLAQATEGKRGLELMIRTEAEQALLRIKKAKEQIAAHKVSVQAAEKNYQVAEERYRVGLANNLEVMEAEVELTQAKAQYLSGVYEYIMARAKLENIMGEPYNKELDDEIK